jgi:hypothetical protein
VDRATAYIVLVRHQPVPAGLFGLRCGSCGSRWPCERREQALNELTGETPLTASVLRQWSER